MSNRASATRPIVAAVCALLLIVLLLWTWHSFYKPSHAPDISREVPTNSALAAGRAPANIRSAVLYDCYEHARENVPPRNDTSARANNWRPPPMPLETARAAISDKKGADGALIEWLENWDTSYRAGKPILNQAKLISLLDRTRLGFEPLFNIGAAMGFLESKSIAAIFHRAALRRAAEDYKD